MVIYGCQEKEIKIMAYYEDYELLEKLRELKKMIENNEIKKVEKEINHMMDNLTDTLIDDDVCPECGSDLEAIIENDETGVFVVGQRCTCCGKEFKE